MSDRDLQEGLWTSEMDRIQIAILIQKIIHRKLDAFYSLFEIFIQLRILFISDEHKWKKKNVVWRLKDAQECFEADIPYLCVPTRRHARVIRGRRQCDLPWPRKATLSSYPGNEIDCTDQNIYVRIS